MLDFNTILKVKQAWNIFKGNHPKVEPFVQGLKGKGFCEGQEIAIAIRYPDGSESKTGIRVQASDLELLKILQTIGK